MQSWVDVATLTQAKTIQGRLVVSWTAGLSCYLEPGFSVAVVPPVIDAPRTLTVSDVLSDDGEEAVVSFEEIRNLDSAEMLVGCHLLVPREELLFDDTIESKFALDVMAGWRVVDATSGFEGKFVRVDEGPAQSLLVVQSIDGAEHFVPLVDEFIIGIDDRNQQISVCLPKGLLEL